MNQATILKVETDNPGNGWKQTEIWDSVQDNPCISPRAGKIYRKFLEDPGITTRFFDLESLDLLNSESPDEAILRFERSATRLGSNALRKCLAAAGYGPADLDGIIVTTCTGYLCPGLTSYISQSVGLRENIFSLDLTGIGCGAALPALRAASQFLNSHPHSRVAVVSVEVCSAALSWGDEIDLILSNSIFADGAAACLMSNRSEDSRGGVKVLDFVSLLWPKHRDDLRFRSRNARLCNVINKNVPVIAATAVKQLHKELGNRTGRSFQHYGVHPGGRKILDETEKVLGLESAALSASRHVLENYGNMSSPSILYVLKTMLEKDNLSGNSDIALFSFGAGFSAFGVALEYQGE